MNQNENHPQGMQGYGQPNTYFQNAQSIQNGMNIQGYPSAQQPGQTQGNYDGYRQAYRQGYAAPTFVQHSGYTTPQVPFAQSMNNGYGQEPQRPVQPYGTFPIGQNTPYSTDGNHSNSGQYGNGGSFIPQTPYSPGYTSPGYQPQQQQGYQQMGYQPGFQQAGFNPYNQMGRIQQPGSAPMENKTSIPLNGGGYVPQKVPVRRKPFALKDWHLIIFGALLIALFVLAVLILNNTPMKIILILLAAGTAALLWIKPMANENKRLTYSILALALCVLTGVSFLLKQPKDITNNTANSVQNAAERNTGVQEIPAQNGNVSQNVRTEVTPTPEVKDNSIMERLVAFFTYWAGNRQDEMLALCAPSWQSKQENPRTSLFSLLSNRRPIDCTPESITGTDADNSRRVTLTSTIDRNNTKKAEKFRMTILMVKENNEWYIDPQSLLSYETIETPDPNITPTVAPTPTAAIYPDTILYYNPNNGEYYHFDPYCRNCSPKITPLQGQFKYSEVNDEPYSKLKPCNVCGAPLRGQ